MSGTKKNVAVVGVTGAVGVEMLECLEGRDFPIGELRPLASARSAGKTMPFAGGEIKVQELTHDSFDGIDIALFSAGGGISKEFGPSAAKAGAVVVDNSSAFRMDDGVPLVVPEINPEAVADHQGIIANPNCTTIVTLMALCPLHRAFGVEAVIASSYQAVSGSGVAGIDELEGQLRAWAGGDKAPAPETYPHPIAFNVIPQVDVMGDNGYTKEEMKFPNESQKILGLPGLKASATCVRVPVLRSHSISVSAKFAAAPDLNAARAAIDAFPGVRVVDDRAAGLYPTPLDATKGADCLVGRIREDLVFENGLSFWVVGDQVLKGAALNAVQIAELL